ncbi:Enoyl-CoA hydratase [Rhodovulum sp. PH10]|uniref:enoyl-CoA hydratase/isomerase family protein n=1 Tax=Rhodovulum sp. PH10 TaxID=1187851 RepID=UPI00027C238E|nr:enoyl-CoA hydratase/isomerase family protein [Rhodovulum sp. PH10]EJW11387.1 Enoyl-CoA hydratase [Rhodovulum sp. PH10]
MLEVRRSGDTVVATMRRAPVNAFDPALIDAFHAMLDGLEVAPPTVLHVRSGERAFCAGADIKMMREYFPLDDCAARMVAHVARMQTLFDRIERLPLVTVAEIAGPALGGGLELALAFDLRIAGYSAALGLPEARIGLVPGAGGTQRLTRLCGAGTAKRIVLGGDTVDGATAERLGLVQWAVPDAELTAFAAATVGQIAGLSGTALAAAKRCIAAPEAPIDTGLLIERLETQRLYENQDTRDRVHAFLNARGGGT